MLTRLLCFGCLILTSLTHSATFGEESKSAAAWLGEFAVNWDESAWTGGRRAYIRPVNDDDWRFRMLALRGLSKIGASADDELLKTLKLGEAPSRILAAQSLGYLGSDVPVAQLLDLLEKESNPSVRLYLVDAIGMMGNGPEASEALQDLRKEESNGDVKKHIGYVLERGAKKVGPDVLRALRDFDVQRIASAELGKPAPDFRLKTANGSEVQLSQFRGKQPVVLVFIYGDT